MTSFVRSAEVRNNSCGYYLSNSSNVFTENTMNLDLSSSPASDSENTCRFFKHFCFCAPCLTVGAVPLLSYRETENRQTLRSFTLSEVIKLNFQPAVFPGEKEKEKTIISR